VGQISGNTANLWPRVRRLFGRHRNPVCGGQPAATRHPTLQVRKPATGTRQIRADDDDDRF
jgi:hypothetical protein